MKCKSGIVFGVLIAIPVWIYALYKIYSSHTIMWATIPEPTVPPVLSTVCAIVVSLIVILLIFSDRKVEE